MNTKIYDVTDYGATCDRKLCTAGVQKAIDDCYAEGGGTVLFPRGVFVLSTVFLKSGVHIVLSEGTEILGAPSFYDYAPEEKFEFPVYQDSSHTYFHCSMFVGENLTDISVTGKGVIDMRSVWDEDDVRKIVHRGPKCIALKLCKNVKIDGITVNNVTDLAIYFAGCENVEVGNVKMRTYIDGVSPDNSKNVYIHDCDIEAGDDAVVLKSSYNLNKVAYCENVTVKNCKLKSRCNGIKFGTESNGGFINVSIENVTVCETRFAGIAIESVDGAIVDGASFKNVAMTNVGTPIFVVIGERMRGPAGREIGKIRNVSFENVTAVGPYEPYKTIEWNYLSYVAKDDVQEPWNFGTGEGLNDGKSLTRDSVWQTSSGVYGLEGNYVENVSFKNVYFELSGGYKGEPPVAKEKMQDYPEVYVYGRILPAKGIFFRYVKNLSLDNVKIKTLREDDRTDFIFDRCVSVADKA